MKDYMHSYSKYLLGKLFHSKPGLGQCTTWVATKFQDNEYSSSKFDVAISTTILEQLLLFQAGIASMDYSDCYKWMDGSK